MKNVTQKPIPFKLVVHHLNEMCGSDRSQNGDGKCLFGKEERKQLMACTDMLELIDWLDSLRELRRL